MSRWRRNASTAAHRWWPVVLAVPLGTAAGAGYATVAHPTYSASSYVVVVPQNPGEGNTAVNFAQAYGRLAAQPQVLAGAVKESGRSTVQLAEVVHGTTSPDAPVIEITGTGWRADEAMKSADAVAKSLITFANSTGKETGVRLVSLASAAEPDRPSSPSAQLDTAVGAAAGVLVGALVMATRRRTGESEAGTALPPAADKAAVPEGTAESAPAPAPEPSSATADSLSSSPEPEPEPAASRSTAEPVEAAPTTEPEPVAEPVAESAAAAEPAAPPRPRSEGALAEEPGDAPAEQQPAPEPERTDRCANAGSHR